MRSITKFMWLITSFAGVVPLHGKSTFYPALASVQAGFLGIFSAEIWSMGLEGEKIEYIGMVGKYELAS